MQFDGNPCDFSLGFLNVSIPILPTYSWNKKNSINLLNNKRACSINFSAKSSLSRHYNIWRRIHSHSRSYRVVLLLLWMNTTWLHNSTGSRITNVPVLTKESVGKCPYTPTLKSVGDRSIHLVRAGEFRTRVFWWVRQVHNHYSIKTGLFLNMLRI